MKPTDTHMDWKRVAIVAAIILMAITAATAPALGQTNARPAALDIDQPRYISDPPGETTENGTRLYEVRGEYLEIEPTNFNQSDVTSFSVREDEATLSYDKQDREYVLNTQGTAGTYHARWTVSEANNTVQYTASIRVLEADYTHVTSAQYEQLKRDAENGSTLRQSIAQSGDPDKPVEQKVEFGNRVRDFANNPFSAFTGQFMALQTLRFLTPAGWLDLGITILLVYGLTRGLYSTIGRLRKQLEKEEQISRREDEQYLKMYKGVLSGEQITDVDGIDDHQAAVLEERLGTNLFTALRNFWTTWGADSLKQMYVDAMATVGYTVRTTRNEQGTLTNVEVLDPSDGEPLTDGGEGDENTTGNAETLPLSNAPGDVVDAMTWEQVDDRVFEKNPDISAVDHLMVANRENDRDLISELNISIPEDFQSRQNFMEAIGRFLSHIQKTDFTDEENYPREDRAVLNHVMAFTSIMEQEYDVPLDLWWRACVWNSEGLSRDDEAESVMNDITDAGSLMDDVDVPGGPGGESSGS